MIKEIDQMVLKIPPPDRHISTPSQFCMNRCLQDAVSKKYEHQIEVNVTGIPLGKQPLYRKLAYSIDECVKSCALVHGYDKFLLKLVELVLVPEGFIFNLARDE